MTREEIKAQLTPIFQTVFKNPALVVQDQLVAADVPGWDSLSNVAMIAEVEKHFKIRVKLREILKMKNVGDLVDCIDRSVASRAG